LDPDFGGRPDTINCTFKQDGQQVTGGCGHDASGAGAALVGEVKDHVLSFQIKTGRRNELTATFTAMLNDAASTMKGEWHFVDDQQQDHQGKFSGRKKGER
jgi:FAD/FMN-containing dehydrogenase